MPTWVGLSSKAQATIGERRAWPLQAGDIAVVEKETVHNLVPLPGGMPLRFFVFNDVPSTCQDVASSDYDNVSRVKIEDLPRQARDERSSVCLSVEKR